MDIFAVYWGFLSIKKNIYNSERCDMLGDRFENRIYLAESLIYPTILRINRLCILLHYDAV